MCDNEHFFYRTIRHNDIVLMLLLMLTETA